MAKRIGIYFLVVTIPLSLYIAAWQSERYSDLRREIKTLSARQEELIESNRRLIAEIAVLSSSSRIERIAQSDLGLEKKEPEDVIEVTIKNKKKDIEDNG
jgi:cell division protein FtsL